MVPIWRIRGRERQDGSWRYYGIKYFHFNIFCLRLVKSILMWKGKMHDDLLRHSKILYPCCWHFAALLKLMRLCRSFQQSTAKVCVNFLHSYKEASLDGVHWNDHVLGYDAMQVGSQAVSKELVASICFPENLDSGLLWNIYLLYDMATHPGCNNLWIFHFYCTGTKKTVSL